MASTKPLPRHAFEVVDMFPGFVPPPMRAQSSEPARTGSDGYFVPVDPQAEVECDSCQ